MENNNIVIQPSQKRSIEDAITTDYDFDIGEIISAAFKATKGVKLNFFLGMLIYMAINYVLGTIRILVFGDTANAGFFIFQIFSSLLAAILLAGFIAITLNWLRSGHTEIADFFSGFKIPLRLVFAALSAFALISIGTILLIIPGIYLAPADLFVNYIILDNPDIKIWDALETSRKIVHKHWFKIFALNLIFVLIILVSMIPLGIGLIWTYPAFFLAQGIIYRKIFDLEELNP